MKPITINNIQPVAYVNGYLTPITNTTPDDVLCFTELNEQDIPCASEKNFAGYFCTPCYNRSDQRIGIFVETWFWNEEWDPNEEGCPETINGPEYLISIPA